MFNNIKLQIYTHFTQVVVNDNVQLCRCDLQLRNAYFVTDIAIRYVGPIVGMDGVNTFQSITIPFNYVWFNSRIRKHIATVDVLTSSERLTHYGGGLYNQSLGGNSNM